MSLIYGAYGCMKTANEAWYPCVKTWMSWDDARIVLAAARAGTFTRAANELGVEQSTISRRVAALEAQLGGAVFLRTRRGLVLTEIGERVLPFYRDAELHLLEARDAASDGVAGLVRIAVTEAMAVHGLLQALPELYAEHPRLRIQVVTGVGISDLERREADIALRFVTPTRGDLVFRRVATLGASLWRQQDSESDGWVDLDLGPVAAPESDWMHAHLPGEPRLICNSYLTMVEAVRAGLGASVISDVLGERVPQLVRVERVPVDLPLFLVGHRASRHTAKVAAVWRFVEGWVAQRMPRPTAP